MPRTLLILTLCIVGALTRAFAQQEVKLWPAPVARHAGPEASDDKRETGRRDRWITRVSEPTLTLYPAANATGPTPVVLVVPGGGFRAVCIDKEGVEPAEWLNAHGITAAVLKYRTLAPEGERSPKTIEPVFADSPRAIRVLRQHAAEWNIDPQRIGVIGFSAGAIMALRLTMEAATAAKAADPIDRLDARPNAVALIYGGVIGNLKAPKELPPFFIVHAVDDPKAPVGAVSTMTKYIQEAKGSFEVHLFRRGDHGFGMSPTKGTAKSWPELYARWLEDIGFLTEGRSGARRS